MEMTPLVDVAFLLVTFFMLTTQLKPKEPISVDKPDSMSEAEVPENNLMTITVSDNGRIFFKMTGQKDRRELIQNIAQDRNINFSQQEIRSFSLTSSFGVPIRQLKQYLNTDPTNRSAESQPGIPQDELAQWVISAQQVNDDVQVALRGDRKAQYSNIKEVINVLRENNMNNISLVTQLERQEE